MASLACRSSATTGQQSITATAGCSHDGVSPGDAGIPWQLPGIVAAFGGHLIGFQRDPFEVAWASLDKRLLSALNGIGCPNRKGRTNCAFMRCRNFMENCWELV